MAIENIKQFSYIKLQQGDSITAALPLVMPPESTISEAEIFAIVNGIKEIKEDDKK